jgi:hypothetical protein
MAEIGTPARAGVTAQTRACSFGAVPDWVGVVALGCVLILPGLGAFGLWDPAEVELADAARGELPRGLSLLTALAFRALGVSALAARLPTALLGLLTVVLIHRVGRRLFGRGAGLAAALSALAAPAFLMQCRQLTSDMATFLALTASIGGLACTLSPGAPRRLEVIDPVIGGLGLALGFWARGLVLGVVFPLAALALALLVARERPTRVRLVLLAVTLAGALAVVGVLWALLGLDLSTMLVGPRRPTTPPTFEAPLRMLGYGLFPWVALVPLALADLVRSRTFAGQLVAVVALLGYLLAALWPALVGPLRFPALPWLALAVGAWAARVYATGDGNGRWGLFAAGVIAVLVVDMAQEPGLLAFSHLEEGLAFPKQLSPGTPGRVVGAVLALLAFVSLSGWQRLRRLGRPLRLTFAALALLCAAWTAHGLVPALSEHLSDRVLLESFRRCGGQGDRLVRFQIQPRGMRYHSGGARVPEIGGRGELLRLLAAPARVFVLVPAATLAEIDHAAREARVAYHVVDDRSSRVLLLSNRLTGACRRDLNPLRRLVSRRPPRPARKLRASFEGKVELCGLDLPSEVTRGGSLPITLYFKVLQQPPPGYKIFLHFEGPGRFLGDHDPLEGRLPTEHWYPGTYLVDPHRVDLPLLTTAGGVYQVYMGLWRGTSRLAVVSGPSDGQNRVRLGRLRVR